MTIDLKPEPPPLRWDPHGVLRVGKTRIPLERVVNEYYLGASPEEIVLDFNKLRLEDVYLVLGFYLRHKEEIDAYIKKREQRGEEMRTRIEGQQESWPEFRGRLLARLRAREDAVSGNG